MDDIFEDATALLEETNAAILETEAQLEATETTLSEGNDELEEFLAYDGAAEKQALVELAEAKKEELDEETEKLNSVNDAIADAEQEVENNNLQIDDPTAYTALTSDQ